MIERRAHRLFDIRPDLAPLPRPDWHYDAACAQIGDVELWFPEKGGSTNRAKLVCAGCPVRAQCLAEAMTRDEHAGVWGGISERERRRMKRAGWRPGDPVPPVHIRHGGLSEEVA